MGMEDVQMNESLDGVEIGRVVGLWRYPVKSMGREELTESQLSWHGLAGDRRWAFVRDQVTSGFPWFTLRQRSDMNGYRPSFVDPDRPDESSVTVRTPNGDTLELTDPQLLDELCGGSGSLIKQSRGIFDTFPISLITRASVSRLSQMIDPHLADTGLDVRRFRPNILIETTDGRPFAEDDWVGHTLTIGNARLRVDQRDSRCVVVTIDPETGERHPAVLRAVAQERDGCLGVYGSTVEPGRIAIGDPVIVDSQSIS